MTENIRLRASSSERWINCPGSARLEHGIPDVPSKYAEEGILAHNMAAQYLEILNANMDTELEGIYSLYEPMYPKVNEDMYYNILKYVNYIDGLLTNINDDKENKILLLVERKVDFSHVLLNVLDATGTCDALIINDNILHIIDLKYGKGVAVEVENNPQLLLYALGAINDLGFLYDIVGVGLHIFQPRINNIKYQYLPIKYLEPWKTFFLEKSQAALAIDAPRIPNQKWCKFCKAKAICPEYQEFNKPFSIDEFDTLTTKQEN